MLQALLCIIHLVGAAELEPFWKSKEKVYERVQNGEVMVAVAREKGFEGKARNRLRIQGGGQVRAPRDFVFKKALEFERLPEVSGFIKSASYDTEKGILSLSIAAFGHRADMRIKVKAVHDSEPKRLEYTVESGALTGLSGAFDFTALKSAKSEVGIRGDFHYDRLPIPTFFAEFGMEVVFKRMAMSLRRHVEREYADAAGN